MMFITNIVMHMNRHVRIIMVSIFVIVLISCQYKSESQNMPSAKICEATAYYISMETNFYIPPTPNKLIEGAERIRWESPKYACEMIDNFKNSEKCHSGKEGLALIRIAIEYNSREFYFITQDYQVISLPAKYSNYKVVEFDERKSISCFVSRESIDAAINEIENNSVTNRDYLDNRDRNRKKD